MIFDYKVASFRSLNRRCAIRTDIAPLGNRSSDQSVSLLSLPGTIGMAEIDLPFRLLDDSLNELLERPPVYKLKAVVYSDILKNFSKSPAPLKHSAP